MCLCQFWQPYDKADHRFIFLILDFENFFASLKFVAAPAKSRAMKLETNFLISRWMGIQDMASLYQS